MARKCAECGSHREMKRFEGETFRIEHAGLKAEVKGLSGWRCGECGEVEFDAESARRYAAVGDDLVLRAREHQSLELKRVRRKLGLSQQDAARLTGGGHNAFSRYERGKAEPLPAVVNLFRILDNHPDLLGEVLPTQADAIARARELNPNWSPSVERVQSTRVGRQDKWRKA